MNRRISTTGKVAVLLAVIATIVIMLAGAEQTFAASKLRISVSIPDKSKPAIVKCRWKSDLKKIKYYKLKCSELTIADEYKEKTVYTRKLKKASGAITLKTLKKNRKYYIIIEAYDKSGKVQKRNQKYIETGVPTPYFDSERTTGYGDHINISIFGIKGIYSPDKAYLYRKAEGGKWTRIKTFKLSGKDYDFEYADKNVETGKKYSYKARVSDTVKVKGKKKTMYSAYSEVETHTAMNEYGLLTCSYAATTPQQKEMPVIDLDITMDKDNYDAVIDFDRASVIAALDPNDSEETGAKYEIAEFKLQNDEWQEAKGKITVNAGESFSLRMKLKDGQKLIDFTNNIRVAVYGAEYNGQSAWIMAAYPDSGLGNIHPDEWE